MARDFAYALEFRDREQVRSVLRSTKYHEGLFDPRAFHFHPLDYALGLASGIEALGGALFEGSDVVAVDLDGAVKVLRTRGGEIQARDVVFATGGYTGAVTPNLSRVMLPIATYVLLTEAAPERIGAVVRAPFAILDDGAPATITASSTGAGGSFGAGASRRGPANRRARGDAARDDGLDLSLARRHRIDVAWSGLMSYARHLMPMIGQTQPHVWHCFGFGGHGLNTTAIGGRVVAEGILGASDRYRLYAPFGLHWAGGPFGRAAAQMTYWSYQAMDFLREFRSARAG